MKTGLAKGAPAGMLSGGNLSRGLDLAHLLLLERGFPRRLKRTPEPEAVMDTADQVRAWHHEGQTEGPLDPIYHFVARTVSRFCPRNGLVIDLGCGTGWFLTHLATLRPDLFAIGFDLSPRMVAIGNDHFREKGFAPRVHLRVGDMTQFSAEAPPETDAVVSLFSMHHLPTPALRDAALAEMGKVRRRTGASVIVFDEVRPRQERTTVLFPKVFTPDAPESFRLDSVYSLRASWTFDELGRAARAGLGPDVKSIQSRFLPLFQLHWAASNHPDLSPTVGFGLANENGRLFRLLRSLFPAIRLAPVTESNTPTPEPETLPGFLLGKARRSPDVRFAYETTEKGPRPIPWQELYDGARDLARGLAWLGLRPGDRIGVFLPNGLAWDVAQFGILWAGGIVVGLDPFSPPEVIADIVRRSQCNGVIVDRLEDIKGWAPETVAGFNWVLTRHLPPADSSRRLRVMAWEELSEAAQSGRVPPIERVRPEDPAALVFTSGTTGRPKGMIYTHRQFATVRRTLARVFQNFGPNDRGLSWLPLSNLFQRVFNLVAMERNVPFHYLANPRDVMTALRQVKPTLLIGVPRFFEKGRQGVLARLPRFAGWVLSGAVSFSRSLRPRHRPGKNIGRLKQMVLWVLDVLIFRWIRQVWGGRLRLVVSGSAPCSPEVLGFFEAIGMPIHESYGVSENMLPVAVNPPGDYRLGSVGKPLPDQEVRLAPDGEVLVRGSTLHQIEIPDRTPFTSDGFYATGDLGRFDEDGYLFLVGRRSEIIKTSNGRKIVLPQLEAHFRDAPGIDQFVIFGHGRSHLVALVRLVPGRSRADLAHAIAERNSLLPRHERLSAVHVLEKDLSPLTGELTPNLKLRRAEIEKRHGNSLETLYADLAREGRGEDVLVR